MEVQQVFGVLLVVVKLLAAEFARARAEVPAVQDAHIESTIPRRLEFRLTIAGTATLVRRLVKEVLVESVGMAGSGHLVVAELATRVEEQICRRPGIAIASERQASDLDHLLQEGDDSKRRVVDGDALFCGEGLSGGDDRDERLRQTHRIGPTRRPALGDLKVVAAEVAHVRNRIPARWTRTTLACRTTCAKTA